MDTPETTRGNDPRGQDSTDTPTSPCDRDNPSGRSLEELVDEVDAETLEQRRHAHSTTDPSEMKRCPACGSVKIRPKTGGPSGARKPGDYRCDGCGDHFDEPRQADETADAVTDGGHPPGHSPNPAAADRSSAAEYYVVDEARPAVVDGPLPMARAKSLANEHGPDHVVASRDAIQLLETAGNTTVRWKTDEDVDVVTDGGFAPCPDCKTDLLVQQSVKNDEDWWCHGCDRHFSSGDPPGGVTIRTNGGRPAGLDEVAFEEVR
jgi:transposase-like protein